MRASTLLPDAQTIFLLVSLLVGAPAVAQELPDSGLPDASVGMGGADQTNEENDVGGPCVTTSECDRGFACTDGRCTPTRVKNLGCASVGGELVLLAALLWNRRERHPR
jgi:hypothetical protein